MLFDSQYSVREIARGVRSVTAFWPGLAAAILVFRIIVAALEGVGLGFILPIIEAGSHYELIERDGEYADLYSDQIQRV